MSKDPEQLSLIDEKIQTDSGPVVCLGMPFENEEARREYFRNELRQKLPELKQMEGFPIGEDEDIITLSDPPYYTACPNPWINDFIEECEKEKVEKYGRDMNEEYHREPFVSDVSEGKSHPVYLSHRYHTKVPHRAIMHYMLHYTNPGDIILDGFSGSGMTGLAARLCDSEREVTEIGLRVDENKNIKNSEEDIVSLLGKRYTILNDLSPIASLITRNTNQFNSSIINVFQNDIKLIIEEIEREYGWLLETNHNEHESEVGKINFTIWSEVFICPSCSSEVVYFDATVDMEDRKVSKELKCINCGLVSNKKSLDRVLESYYDDKLGKVIEKVKFVPVYINYSVGNKRFMKKVDKKDKEVINKTKELLKDFWYPSDKMPLGEESSRNDKYGLTHVHHMMSDRNLLFLSILLNKLKQRKMDLVGKILLTASIPNLTWNYSWRMNGKGGFISGTLYIPSTPQENNPINQMKRKLSDLIKGLNSVFTKNDITSIITTQSLTNFSAVNDNSIDYIFTDPPFGSNLMYSELNFIWESWLKVFTNNNEEAIVNNVQEKSINDYQRLLEDCFDNYFRVLKPGRWMTVEFSNSQASVWNSIQEAIQKSGFVIANVSALDKQQGSFKAITTTTAVKQDLVITAYKPKLENTEKIKREQNTQQSAWTFVKQHLEQLPVFIGVKGEAQIISERTPRILFDRMVAYHVQNGFSVPISSADFQAGVAQQFPMRDGMAFLENQVAEYDKKRTLVKEFAQMSLFVSDENSAIEWIRQQLLRKPQSRQDIHPNYMKEIQHIAKHELLPELDDLLHQNFLLYDGEGNVPDPIIAYLRRTYKDLRGLEPSEHNLIDKAKNRWYVPDPNKQSDLEKLREKALLREFDSYLGEMENSKKKLKQFRTEAIRAGFKKAYSEKDFERIVKVGERLPESIIQEDDKLLMYYDNACIRLGL